MANRFLKISGDYTNWNIYRKSVIISDVTEMFIRRAMESNTRTSDQMRQAARSCKQNIVEGISDSTASVEMCIKLLGVARGSARELREDYGDFLRQHDMVVWQKEDERAQRTRSYCVHNDNPAEFVAKCKERNNETVANIMLIQLYQIDSMLAGALKRIEADFLASGGVRESMSQARRNQRGY